MAWEIPLAKLRLRATVTRMDVATGEYTNTIYTNLPCRIGLHRNMEGRPQDHVSSEVELPIFFCNFLFNSVPVDIKFEDRIIIDRESYRVLNATNAESADHHLEIGIEHLKTMRTSP